MIRKSMFFTVLEALTNLKFFPYTSYMTSVKAPMCFTSLHIQKPKPCKRLYACLKVNTGSNFSISRKIQSNIKKWNWCYQSIHTKMYLSLSAKSSKSQLFFDPHVNIINGILHSREKERMLKSRLLHERLLWKKKRNN